MRNRNRKASVGRITVIKVESGTWFGGREAGPITQAWLGLSKEFEFCSVLRGVTFSNLLFAKDHFDCSMESG